ncbi:nitrate reductase subunit alpha [Neobacillus sp. PS3-40]|uniref:nitrate reductase subunit alpha n=1 Tax=Neobacillus sp. PS3-40 TaxID=3070679 RepID=UPI0027DEB0C6|nr:nitrate reductase subunit alpha [Neobacillus sp. PS3-40]WML44921.1 nitrate reductase subunit alpha [Neobacillus sp. PS3-40]
MDRKRSPLMKKLKFFGQTEDITNHAVLSPMDRETEKVYRRRWQHDKTVRTTHGVNCTGSCSWKVHVKDGIIAWETQQTDYPSTGPNMPEYEPRGCPRGASFSWYTYSPLRVRYPYIRGALLKLWREELEKTKDPVKAWREITTNPDKSKRYKQARGKGGLVRSSWKELNELISAALIYSIQEFGPDRIFGFSPIPAMSMVSYAAGARFLSLIGGSLLSFYDWYADLPPASPQVWGEQTDVPESSDWYNSSYLLVWGSNVPQTRTPDAHFMVEARYRGTKVVAVSPDYAEFVKFADNWLPVRAGMDGALGMAMTHVILKEFYVDKETEYFIDYAKKFTDLPFLVKLKPYGDQFISSTFLRASEINPTIANGDWKTVVWDQNKNQFAFPNGTIGHRWEDKGNWNLHLNDTEQDYKDIKPLLTILGNEDKIVPVAFSQFEEESTVILKRSVPVKSFEQNGETVYFTTVFDLMLSKFGISRGLEGDFPKDYDDPKPYTPAWQEALTGVDRKLAAQIAREFAQNAVDSKGRSMIIMGSGINQWYHADATYRTVLNLVLLTGSQGVNGGGWAHYVGQEKVRPLEGFSAIAMARDWGGPPRLHTGTSFFYFVTEQWKYDDQSMVDQVSPLVDKPRYNHGADYNYLGTRLGWTPSYPQFDKNPIKMVGESGLTDKDEIVRSIVKDVKEGNTKFAIQNPEDPKTFPKVMFVWRGNLIGSSSKGHEYFLKHLLGTHNGVLGEQNTELKTEEIEWGEDSAEGKLDLMINMDFRMVSSGLFSDIVLPAATWYEKYDISSTDMHPFIHPFNPAIAAPWESRSDWDTFKSIANTFSEMAEKYFKEPIQDIVATPLLHDSRDEISEACAFGKIPDWLHGEQEPVPGQNFPRLHIVERDYPKVYDKFISIGPMVKEKIGAHGIGWSAKEEYEKLKEIIGKATTTKEYKDHPSILTGRDAAEAILSLSSSTNGSLAMKGWDVLEKKTGQKLKDLAEERAEEHLSFNDITAQPRQVISTPVFSGTETGGRRYSPFTTNVERLVPWRTLTGRQHFYLDHEMMLEFGEEFPEFKPPLRKAAFKTGDNVPSGMGKEISLRYLTPHFKWSYHSTYFDNLLMLTLFRGGPTIWLNRDDAEEAGITDNDWLQIYNRNGVVVARAVVTHRLPKGVSYMYHVQERHINVPGSPITKQRGGTFNSPNRIYMKPTHMIGGYAQLSYGFNYYGPCGSQRDEKVVICKLDRNEVNWLED